MKDAYNFLLYIKNVERYTQGDKLPYFKIYFLDVDLKTTRF
jgi:hypothetical protein